MRQIAFIVLAVILVVSIAVGWFTFSQTNKERLVLMTRLESRTQVLAESLADSIVPSHLSGATSTIQRIADKFAGNQRLEGLSVFDNRGASVARSGNVPNVPDTTVAAAMSGDTPGSALVESGEKDIYAYVLPLHDTEGRVIGALMVVQDATYISDSITQIWKSSLLRLLLLIAFFSGAIVFLVWWAFFRPVAMLAETIRSIRRGDGDIEETNGVHSFLAPITNELSKITTSLRQARLAASEEARMRLEKIDTPWTAGRLREFIKAYLKERPIFVVSNREPYVHSRTRNTIFYSMPAGGVVTAIEPVMEACEGMWIAHGSGNADRVTADAEGKIMVPPDEPKYTLKRVWLTEGEIKGYYTGFSNEALWPLCHMAHVRPLFRKEDWTEYRRVNGLFAKTVLEEIRNIERPLILVQDYHFALLPELIKKSRPDALVSIFWHIPWPSAAQFSICPWRKELIEGMLGADMVGFHTQQYCNNFMDTAAAEVESRIDFEHFSIFRAEHRTFVKPFPIPSACPGEAEPHGEPDRGIFEKLGIRSKYLILGVDRLDYTKGIMERFKGIDFLLTNRPDYIGNLTLLQISSPSRESVEKYRQYGAEVTAEAERINQKFGTRDWKPIVLEKRNYSHDELRHLYQLANVCLVTSLHDGMNLVAKEFVAAREDESGVLVLSQFAGASRDLKDALIINPYSAENTSETIHKALTMSAVQQHRRMRAMRGAVRDYNVYRWSAEMIKALAQLE